MYLWALYAQIMSLGYFPYLPMIEYLRSTGRRSNFKKTYKKMTARSDFHESSIFNLKSSILIFFLPGGRY